MLKNVHVDICGKSRTSASQGKFGGEIGALCGDIWKHGLPLCVYVHPESFHCPSLLIYLRRGECVKETAYAALLLVELIYATA